MLNQVVLVGRIKEMHEGEIIISIPRNYKNKDGKYDNDLITVFIRGQLNDTVQDYCSIEDIIAVKGRVTVEKGNTIIVAEKVTFLSNTKRKD